MEVDYKASLVSGDLFFVGVNFKKISPLRFEFQQDIYLKESHKLVLKAKVIGTAVDDKGRPFKDQNILNQLI